MDINYPLCFLHLEPINRIHHYTENVEYIFTSSIIMEDHENSAGIRQYRLGSVRQLE